jgi:Protein of unknown function (DUF3014)
MLDDFELEKEPAQSDAGPPTYALPPERRSLSPFLIAIVVLLVAGAAAWFFLTRPRTEPPAEAAAASQPAAAAPPSAVIQPLCATAGADAALPALNDSDAFAKKSASNVSTHPRVAAWLATDNVIRSFVVAVDNVASGATPVARMGALRPTGAFRAREARGEMFIDPRSFERYRPVADAVESLDVGSAAALCGTLKPRLVEAYAELGRDGSFDVALERAIVQLLRTPAVGEDTRIVPHGASYAFEDEALEKLTPAQKQLARMGPRNARVIQDKLRQLAQAIGIPADRLPQ